MEVTEKQLSAIEFDAEKWKKAMPKDMSRRQVGKIVDFSHANLSSIEKGRSLPGLILLARYAVLTGKPIEFFFKGIPIRNTKGETTNGRR